MSRPPALAPRTDFGPPPPGYVPGLGRGAVGFTTRSDIGPARPAFDDNGVPERGAPPPGFPGAAPRPAGAPAKPAGEEEKDYSDATFDEFSGFSEQLFASGAYDQDDKDADALYEAIDKRMDSRRKERREKFEQEQLEEDRKSRPKIADLFRPLKRSLASMDEKDWQNIPEPLDISRQNKLRKKQQEKMREKFTAVPDSVITSSLGGAASAATVQGTETPAGMRDLTAVGETANTLLTMKLDRVADSVSGQTVVDPKGYLTDLNSIRVNNATELSDIKKARLLINSLLQTNPNHPPAWIAAARLEAETGKIPTAKKIIAEGTTRCPNSEDIWLEAARLHKSAGAPEEAKILLARALKRIPTSVKLWLAARDLETTLEARRAVLRKALDLLPTSEALWRSAIEQETAEDARIMLSRATECCPTQVDFWLALARLESYDNAKKVLNQARAHIPTDPTIWTTAAKLEEAHGNVDSVDLIIQAAVRNLNQQNAHIERDTWLTEAENAEKSGAIATCQALIRHTVGIGVEELDQKNTWTNDAQLFLQRGAVQCARAVYQHMLSVYPGKKALWMEAAQVEKQHGTAASLDAVLERACTYCPKAEELWLMRAKEKWLQGDVTAARAVLDNAFAANTESEDIWLAAVKLESENLEFERARVLLARARGSSGTARVFMKAAILERSLGNHDAQLALLEEGITKFPTYPKLHMMMGQFWSAKNDPEKAREAYRKGLKLCPNSVDLWLCAAQLEIQQGALAKARSTLETARLKNPKDPKLWLAAVRLEQRAQNQKVADQLLAKAQQECPTSGILWAHAIASANPPQRKAKSYDALKATTDDPNVFVAVAKLFWLERKISKARDWFERAITVDPDLGDAWAYSYKFELQHGDQTLQERVIKRCAEASPRHGELWIKIIKDPSNKTSPKIEDVLKKTAALIGDLFPLNID